MSTILAQLREGDHFNIITFSDHVHTWRRGQTVRATRQNVREATEFVRRMIADGCESAAGAAPPASLNQNQNLLG